MSHAASKRSGDDGPLATTFMLGLMVVITIGGVWLATREKPGPPGGRQVDPNLGSHLKVAGNDFAEALKRLPKDVAALQQVADGECGLVLNTLGDADRAE